jgi:hypothetical protein
MSTTKSFEFASPADLDAAAETIREWCRQVDARVTGLTVTVTYETELPWPVAEGGEPLVGVVYQGLYDLDPENDGLKLV